MTTTFSLDVTEITRQAYLRIGGEPTTGQNARDARTALNLLFLDMANRGSPLAKVELKTKTIAEGDTSVTLDQEDSDVLDVTISYQNTDIPMTRLGLEQFNHIPNKNQQARPTQFAVVRSTDSVQLKLWPKSDDTYTLSYYSIVRFEDVTGPRDSVDINDRYLPAVISGLSWYLSFNDKDFPLDKRDKLEQRFEQELDRARVEDQERVSLEIVPFNYK